MPKFFFALEKKTLEAYRDSRNEAVEAAPKMSSAEISEWKTELIKTANIRALPSEVESSRFEPPPFFTIDDEGTANIEVSGVLLNFVDFFDFFFDDPITTFGFIREAALRADEDPQVKKIRFNVSTPGGMVDGVDLTSHVIANLNKPTETVGFGMIASAGIWLFSQTDKIIASDPTVFFGSIGVAMTLIDRSKMREEMGIEIVELVNDDSPDKRPNLSTDEGRGIIIKELNDLFKIFVQRVAEGRKTTIQNVKKNFGKGGVLIAADAQKVGLIDQVELQSSTMGSKSKSATATGTTDPPKPAKKPDSVTNNTGKPMTEQQFLAFLETNPEAKAFYDGAMVYIKAVADAAPDISALSLTDVLALAPTAKTDHETALTDARATVEAGKLTAEAVKQVGGIIGSAEYGASIKAAGIKVLTGEKDHSSFEDLVALADEQNEKIKALQIASGQPPNTPGDPGLTQAQAAQAKTKASATALSDAINNTDNKVQ